MQPLRILLVEDEYLFASVIRADVMEEFPSGTVKITILTTESQFNHRFKEGVAAEPVDVVILDVMIRWTSPDQPEPKSDEALAKGYYTAGIRCLEKLRARKDTAHVPVIIHSNLSREETEQKLEGVSKGDLQIIPKSGDRQPLLKALQTIANSGETTTKAEKKPGRKVPTA